MHFTKLCACPTAVALGLALFFGVARGDIQSQAVVPAPPAVAPVTAVVERGGETIIRLRTIGRPPPGTRYLIRTRPAAGELRRGDPGDPRVVYRHSGGGDSDEFTFAAQAPGTGVSAPAKVKIAVVDPQPVLAAPNLIDFGTFVAGESASREILIQNTGGGRLIGRLSVPAEVSLDGPESINLGPSGQRLVVVKLSRTNPGHYSGSLGIETQLGRHPVALVAEVIPPFQAGPGRVELTNSRGVRSATVKLTSRIDEPSFVEILGGEVFGLPGMIALGPKATSSLDLALSGDHPGAMDREIVLRRGQFEQKLRVVAPPLPARLSVEPEGMIDLGSIVAGLPAKVAVRVYNRGGQGGFVRIAPIPDFNIPKAREPFHLEPGEGTSVEAILTPRHSGPLAKDLIFTMGEETLRIGIRADVRLPSDSRPPPARSSEISIAPPSPGPAPDAAIENPDGLPAGHAEMIEAMRQRDEPRVSALRLVGRKGRRAWIEWRHFPEADGYGIEQLFLSIKDRQLHKEWRPFRTVRIMMSDANPRAELFDLPKYGWVMLRVRAFKQGAAFALPSDELHFLIPRPVFPWGWLLTGTAIIGGVWWWLRRRRNAARREESADAPRFY